MVCRCATALGSVSNLREWWDTLARLGPSYGYFPSSSKTWLVTKEGCYSKGIAAFVGTGVNVTCEGRPHLGAAVGSSAYIEQFVTEKVWCDDLTLLSHTQLSQHSTMGYPASGHISLAQFPNQATFSNNWRTLITSKFRQEDHHLMFPTELFLHYQLDWEVLA